MKTSLFNHFKTSWLFYFILFTLILFNAAQSANRYWVSTINSNWNNTSNWSSTPGGAGGASVPGLTDIAIFDGSGGSNGNCNLDIPVTVSGLQLNINYTGSIAQNSFQFITGGAGAVFTGGTFIGGNAPITFNGPFTLNGSSFSSSQLITEFLGTSSSFLSGTFNPNNSLSRFDNTQNINFTTPITFNDIDFQSSLNSLCVFTITGTCFVNGKMSISGSNQFGFKGNGNIELKNDLYLMNTTNNSINDNLFNLRFNGTGNQTIYGASTPYMCSLPNTIINKNTGALYVKDYVTFKNDYTYISGNVNCTTYTNTVIFSSSKSINISGAHALNDVIFGTSLAYSAFTVSGNLTILNTMKIEGAGFPSGNGYLFNGTGSIDLSGDLYLSNLLTGFKGHGNTFSLNINGNGNQTVYGSSTPYACSLPNVSINKTAGTLFFKDYICFEKNYTYVNGNIDCTTFTNTQVFSGSKTINITGNHTLNNVIFGTDLGTSSFSLNGNLTVLSTMRIEGIGIPSGSGYQFTGSGSIYLHGDLYLANLLTGFRGHGNLFNLYINGTSNQTINGSLTPYTSTLPNVIINKTSGTLFLKDYISFEKDYSYISGAVNFTTYTNTEVFSASKNINITGSQSLNNVIFGTNLGTSVFSFNGNLTILNNMYIEGVGLSSGGSGYQFSGTGNINLHGDLHLTNLLTGFRGHGNSFVLHINGTSNQTIHGSLTPYTCTLPNVTINKTSGTLFLKNYISFEKDYSYINGAVDFTTFTNTEVFSASKNINITGYHALGNVIFGTNLGTSTFNFNGTLTIQTSMTIEGAGLPFGSNYKFTGNGNINLSGDLYALNLLAGLRYHGASFNLNLISPGNQTVQGNASKYTCSLPNLVINKPSGSLILKNYITFENNYTHLSGTIDYTTHDNTVHFIANKTINIPPNYNLRKVDFNSSYANMSYSITTNLIVTDTLFFTGNQLLSCSSGTIEAKKDIKITNTYPVTCNHANTSLLLINGTGNQSLLGTALSGQCRLTNLSFNKTAGMLTIYNMISCEGDVNYINGNIDAVTHGSGLTLFRIKNIDMTNNSSTVKLYNVFLGDNLRRTLTGNMTVSNVLNLGNGNIDLNSNTLRILNSSTTAIIQSGGGHIISEKTDNSSKLSWFVGTTPGNRVFPLGKFSGESIPFSFNLTSGNIDTVIVSSYPTNGNNIPFPSNPDLVTNLTGFFNLNNSAFTVNRFWQIDKTGISGTADITFTYGNAEWDGVTEPTDYQAQRYNKQFNFWEFYLPAQTQNTLNNTVTVPNVTSFSPWTLSRIISPLPIQLTDFTATYNSQTEHVNLEWKTVSEINNDFFSVERSSDAINWELVFEKDGAGNSNTTLYYSGSDEKPYNGVSYYRLKQTDFNGAYSYSPIKDVKIHAAPDFLIQPNPADLDITLTITHPGSTIAIYNAIGQIVYFENSIAENELKKQIDIRGLEGGAYWIRVQSAYGQHVKSFIKRN